MLFVLSPLALLLVSVSLQSLKAFNLAMLSRTEDMLLALLTLLNLSLFLKLLCGQVAISGCLGPPLTLLALTLKFPDQLTGGLLVLPLSVSSDIRLTNSSLF